ncbi:MAG: hypothetical protein M1827_001985 [Pycnora praestabilis]|nr:MAG: hypothetical protein M1827_001985 [Pycnora praestabilis]
MVSPASERILDNRYRDIVTAIENARTFRGRLDAQPRPVISRHQSGKSLFRSYDLLLPNLSKPIRIMVKFVRTAYGPKILVNSGGWIEFEEYLKTLLTIQLAWKVKKATEDFQKKIDAVVPLKGFVKLPLELRDQIYELCLNSVEVVRPYTYRRYPVYPGSILQPPRRPNSETPTTVTSLLLTNGQIHDEVSLLLYSRRTFWFSKSVDLENLIKSPNSRLLRKVELAFDPMETLSFFHAEPITGPDSWYADDVEFNRRLRDIYQRLELQTLSICLPEEPRMVYSNFTAGGCYLVICKWIMKAVLARMSHVRKISFHGGSLTQTQDEELRSEIERSGEQSYKDLAGLKEEDELTM